MALKQLQEFAQDLNSLVNKHGATYDEFSEIIDGKALTDITDEQINVYFNDMLSVDGIAIIKSMLVALENTIPAARISKEGIDASQYSSLDKLTG